MKNKIKQILDRSNDRFAFCTELINENKLETICELGVYRGDFAEKILRESTSIEKYIMIDPWRHLSDWNKPFNKENDIFEGFYQETLDKTEFAKEKRIVLRGKTTEVIDQLENDSLDLVYIDGDHTLKGITIDLINIWPKVKENGYIIGDDFSASIWQHSQEYEPTMIFPFAVYFAEAVNAKIYGLPFDQFIMVKDQNGFEFIDFTEGKYSNLELRSQLTRRSLSTIKKIARKIPFASKIYSAMKK